MQVNIGKTDRVIQIDLVKLFKGAVAANPDFAKMIELDPVATYVIRYGLTQALNDAHSQITSKSDPDEKDRAEKAWNLANKKLDALYAGELRAERVGKPKDPVMAEAMVLAKAFLVAQEVRKGATEAVAKKRVDALDRAKVADWSRGYLERNPEVVEKARAIVAARAESVTDDADSVDLDALMADPVTEAAA
jgi:hypothetical protein